MRPSALPARLLDLAPAATDVVAESISGLSATPRTLPCKLLYDARGSELFEAICELPEYYPTRTEIAIIQQHRDAMARWLGPDVQLIEFGSGSGLKTRLLLDRMRNPVAYVPIEISRSALWASARSLTRRYPWLEVLPVCADYTQPLEIPDPWRQASRKIAYFPGSTIGNFDAPAARHFLDTIAELVGPGGGLLIGVDLKKDPGVLLPAYDDAAGVTAQFNLNILRRLNREAKANFQLDAFAHRARWNEAASRVEMHLESLVPQVVRVAGREFAFERGETIWTESSHKYTLDRFAQAASAFHVRQVWTDTQGLFSVQYLEPRA